MEYNKIAVLGHSFVSHLKRKTFQKGNVETSIRLDLGLNHTEARYFGAPGLTTAGVRRFKRHVREFGPHVVVLLLGENDMHEQTAKGYSNSPTLFAKRLVSVASLITAWSGGSKVIIGQLMPRFWSHTNVYFQYYYNEWAEDVNFELVKMTKNVPGVCFWRHKFICEGDSLIFRQIPHLFDKGGVHLNVKGEIYLLRSLKHAVLHFRD